MPAGAQREALKSGTWVCGAQVSCELLAASEAEVSKHTQPPPQTNKQTEPKEPTKPTHQPANPMLLAAVEVTAVY